MAILLFGAIGSGSLLASGDVLVAIALVVGLGRAAFRAARALLPGEDTATMATASLTLLVATWTAYGTVLGHLGILTPRYALAGAALAVVATGRAERKAERHVTGPSRPVGLERALLGVTMAFFAASLVVELARQFHAPPGAQGYDDTSYHLSAVATWFQWGDLRMIKFPVGDGSTSFYPFAGELFSYLLLAPLNGVDVLARWSELPFGLGALIALASIGRQLAFRDVTTAMVVAIHASSRRIFPTGLLGAGNDHAMAFFLLSATSCALMLRTRRDLGAWVLLGSSIGLVIGTKYSGPMLLPGLLVLVTIGSAAQLRSGERWTVRRRLRSTAAGALLAIGVAACVGGYPYLRNAATSGNPVFPATVRLFGQPVFQGWGGETLEGFAVRGRSEIDPLGFLWERVDLLGPLFRWTLLPSALLAFPVAALVFVARRLRRPRSGTDPFDDLAQFVLLGLPIAHYFAFVYLMVDHRDIRYAYGALALSAVSAGWLVERLPPVVSSILRPLVVAAALFTLASGRWSVGGPGLALTLSALAALFVLGGLLLRSGRPFANRDELRRALPAVAVVALLALAALGGRLVNSYVVQRLRVLPASAFVARTAPPGTTVAFCGGNQPYLFFGSRLERPVLYVPTFDFRSETSRLRPPLAATFYTWKGPLEFPHERADRRQWLQNLEFLEVSLVVVARTGDEQPERDWISASPDAFRRIWKDARFEVFSFRGTTADETQLVLRFDQPESADYLSGDWVGPSSESPARHGLRLLQGRGVIRIPPLDAAANALALELVGDTTGAPPPVVEINGTPVRALETTGPVVTYEISPAKWRAGRNSIAISRDPARDEHELRIVSLALSLGAPTVTARPKSGDLPGNVDRPEESSTVSGGELVVAGWCRERGGGRIDTFRFFLDGHEVAPIRLIRPDRPDVVAALPYVVEPRETGFEAVLDVSALPPGAHSVVVEVETPDGRRRTFPPRPFVKR